MYILYKFHSYQIVDETDYEFDAFIAYNDDDRDDQRWVASLLPVNLEKGVSGTVTSGGASASETTPLLHDLNDSGEISDPASSCSTSRNLRLFYSGRDIPAGPILQHTGSYTRRSRNIVYIVSTAFLQSDWANFQLNMGMLIMSSRLQPEKLIIVLKSPIDLRQRPDVLTLIMARNSFLEWPSDNQAGNSNVNVETESTDNSSDEDAFWKRLRELLSLHIMDM
jgi:hypothetical protein